MRFMNCRTKRLKLNTTQPMENKNVIQYVLLLAVSLLCVLAVINLIKGSSNLKESKSIIDNVLKEVAESGKIIERQSAIIIDLQKLNKELSTKVNVVDSINKVIKKNLDVHFYRANKTINDIKKTVDDIKTIQIH